MSKKKVWWSKSGPHILVFRAAKIDDTNDTKLIAYQNEVRFIIYLLINS